MKDPDQMTDTELLDYLDGRTGTYTGNVICRDSITDRGWRLYETDWPGAVPDVRTAIRNYIRINTAGQ